MPTTPSLRVKMQSGYQPERGAAPEELGGMWEIWHQGHGLLDRDTDFFVVRSNLGASLVVQRLRVHAPNTGGQTHFLVREVDPTSCN